MKAPTEKPVGYVGDHGQRLLAAGSPTTIHPKKIGAAYAPVFLAPPSYEQGRRERIEAAADDILEQHADDLDAYVLATHGYETSRAMWKRRAQSSYEQGKREWIEAAAKVAETFSPTNAAFFDRGSARLIADAIRALSQEHRGKVER